ncbi:hypothetical protein HRR83_001046 [Exophiala dermatitidis]|uniref:Uncharacterized protein n=2 Tax=Exophiala dermatitidis TaxID=5970 RepID=H6C7I2_EXODN
MLFVKAALGISSLIVLAAAQEPVDAIRKTLTPGFSKVPANTNQLLSRSLDKRCSGSCAQCFGDGYTLCPGSTLYCYLPGDSLYGLDSCTSSTGSSGGSGSGGSSGGSATASAPASSSTGTDTLCTQKGATCKSCFGSTFQDCPDGFHCYDPNDPLYNTCPDSGSTGSGSGSTTTSQCEAQFGSGSEPCGTDACYNPGEGDVCCQDGYHCEGGYSCSANVGKCCAPGSTASGCSKSSGSSGLGGGLVSSSSSSTTRTSSRSTAIPTSGDSFTSATTGDGFLVTTASTGSATAAATESSQTGVNQLANGVGSGPLVDSKLMLVAAGLGAALL